MTQFKIKKVGYFEAAHRIPGHDKCGRLHGHTYKIVLCVGGPVLDEEGMLIDFAELGKVMKYIIETCDHRYLNDMFTYTTAEHLAYTFCRRLKEAMSKLDIKLNYYSCEVWETQNNCAIYEEFA